MTARRGASVTSSGTNGRTVALLGVLVVVALYVLLWRPQATQLGEARDRRADIEADVSSARAELAAAGTDPAESTGGEFGAARLRAVPGTPELAALLRSLDELAAAAGLELDSIAPSPPSPNPDMPGASLQIAVTGRGSRASVYAFFASLRTLERIVVVEQIELLDAPVVDGDVPGVQVQLGLRAFVAVPGAGAQADATAERDASPAD